MELKALWGHIQPKEVLLLFAQEAVLALVCLDDRGREIFAIGVSQAISTLRYRPVAPPLGPAATRLLNWAAGVVTRARWVVSVVYAVLKSVDAEPRRRGCASAGRPTLFSTSGSGRRVRRVTPHLFDTARTRLPLSWVHALLEPHGVAPLLRRVPWETPTPQLGLLLDASPWGLGGVLYHLVSARPVGFCSSRLTNEDGDLLAMPLGEAAAQQSAEVLSLLVALRLWGKFFLRRRPPRYPLVPIPRSP